MISVVQPGNLRVPAGVSSISSASVSHSEEIDITSAQPAARFIQFGSRAFGLMRKVAVDRVKRCGRFITQICNLE